MSDFWNDCVSEAFDEAEIVATPEQIRIVAEAMEGCHDNYGTYHGHDVAFSGGESEADKLRRELKAEKAKFVCPSCKGNGVETGPVGTSHSYVSQCPQCRGEGRVSR